MAMHNATVHMTPIYHGGGFDLGQLLLNMGVSLLALVVVGVVVSLIRLHGETANSFKLRTALFIVAAFAIQQFWLFTIPIYLTMAYRSFRAGPKAAQGMSRFISGKFSANRAEGWIATIVGMMVAFHEAKPKVEEDEYDVFGNPLLGSGLQMNKYTGKPKHWS